MTFLYCLLFFLKFPTAFFLNYCAFVLPSHTYQYSIILSFAWNFVPFWSICSVGVLCSHYLGIFLLFIGLGFPASYLIWFFGFVLLQCSLKYIPNMLMWRLNFLILYVSGWDSSLLSCLIVRLYIWLNAEFQIDAHFLSQLWRQYSLVF